MDDLALLAPAVLALTAAVFVLIFSRRLRDQRRRAIAAEAKEPPVPPQ